MASRVCAKSYRALFVSFVLLGVPSLRAADIDVDKLPKPTGYVSDLAHVVSPSEKEQLEEFCTKVDQQLGVQFALVTVNSIGDRPIRDVALDIARKWGVGSKKNNEGLVLLLAIQDRKSDIETGYGMEPYITDGFAGSTLRSMRPQLQSGNYGTALMTAAHAMTAQIAQGKGIPFSDAALPQRAPPRQRHGPDIPFPLILLGIFFLLWLLSRGGGRRGGGYRGGGGGGFLTGMILGNMMGRRDYGGSGWGAGGGFGGGSSGGGGFGGFGGGDFGGGGASSNW
jgi:uncharacterized protein